MSQPSDTLYFLTFSLSAQCVRHFAPISSNLWSEPTKLTLIFFETFFFKKKNKNSLQVLNDRSKYPPKHCSLIRSALFYNLVEFLNKENCFLLFFDDFFLYPCVRFSGIWVQFRGLCLLSQPSDTFIFFLTFSLSAQCVRYFAPFSSNLGSEPAKLTLVFFETFFFQKKNKNSLQVLNDRSKYPPRHCLLIRSALFYNLVVFIKQIKLFFAVF